MTTAPTRRPRASAIDAMALAGLAWAGDLVGHWLAYVLAVPGVTTRDALLVATGHQAYWHAAVATGLVLGLASLLAFLGRRFFRGFGAGGSLPAATLTWSNAARRLAPIQVAIYVVQETMERLLAHAPLSTLLVGHVLVIGMELQVLLGFVLAFALVRLGWAAEAIGAALRTRPGQPRLARSEPRPWPRSLTRQPAEFSPRLTRGPPACPVRRQETSPHHLVSR